MFTMDNTEDFSATDLVLLNQALTVLVEQGMEENAASDRINNNWQPEGNTIESLIRGSEQKMNQTQIDQIESLQTAAGTAGDLLQAAICQIAINGEPDGLTVSALSARDQEELFRVYADQETNTEWKRQQAVDECLRVIRENA